MVQEQIFPAFQLFAPEVKHFYQKNTKKNSQMRIQFITEKFSCWVKLRRI